MVLMRTLTAGWTMAVRNWKEALNHFVLMFEDRVPELKSK